MHEATEYRPQHKMFVDFQDMYGTNDQTDGNLRHKSRLPKHKFCFGTDFMIWAYILKVISGSAPRAHQITNGLIFEKLQTEN